VGAHAFDLFEGGGVVGGVSCDELQRAVVADDVRGELTQAGELGSGVFFNPVAPEAAAQALREAK